MCQEHEQGTELSYLERNGDKTLKRTGDTSGPPTSTSKLLDFMPELRYENYLFLCRRDCGKKRENGFPQLGVQEGLSSVWPCGN